MNTALKEAYEDAFGDCFSKICAELERDIFCDTDGDIKDTIMYEDYIHEKNARALKRMGNGR